MNLLQRACTSLPVMLLLGPAVIMAADGHDGHEHSSSVKPKAEVHDMNPRIPDPVLIDQDGKAHRFYTDLVKGKVVLMNSIYTTCPGTCPTQTAIFARVQHMLGDRVGQEVQMISVSLDPVTDTPERLKEFAGRYKAGPGWTFLTGPKQDVAEVLRAMDLYSSVPADHTPIAAIGHEPGLVWMKAINLTSPTDIVGRVDLVKSLGERRVSPE